MNRYLLTLLTLFSLVSTSLAEIIILEVDDTKPGVWKVTVGTDGSVKTDPIKRVIRLNPTGGPVVPPDPTVPVNLKPFTDTIKRLTDEAIAGGGSKTTAAAIASVYSLVGDKVQDGSIAVAAWPKAIKDASDAIFILQTDKDKWVDFRAKLSTSLGALQQVGELDIKDKVSPVLKAVSAGMNQSSGFQPAMHGNRKLAMAKSEEGILDGIDIDKIIRLIELIMKILEAFGGN